MVLVPKLCCGVFPAIVTVLVSCIGYDFDFDLISQWTSPNPKTYRHTEYSSKGVVCF